MEISKKHQVISDQCPRDIVLLYIILKMCVVQFSKIHSKGIGIQMKVAPAVSQDEKYTLERRPEI